MYASMHVQLYGRFSCCHVHHGAAMQKREQNEHGSAGLAPGIEPQLVLTKIVRCRALTTWPR